MKGSWQVTSVTLAGKSEVKADADGYIGEPATATFVTFDDTKVTITSVPKDQSQPVFEQQNDYRLDNHDIIQKHIVNESTSEERATIVSLSAPNIKMNRQAVLVVKDSTGMVSILKRVDHSVIEKAKTGHQVGSTAAPDASAAPAPVANSAPSANPAQ